MRNRDLAAKYFFEHGLDDAVSIGPMRVRREYDNHRNQKKRKRTH
jgi:hypothetical protein